MPIQQKLFTHFQRFVKTMIFVVYWLFCCCCIISAQAPLDLKSSLDAVLDNSKDLGNLHDVPKWLVQGDLFSRGYKLAERNMSKTAVEWIQQVHRYLSAQCNGEIGLWQVTTVFQNTDAGRKLYALLECRNQVASLNDWEFAEACVQVYLCANADQELSKKDIRRLYTLQTYEQCQNIVQTIYQSIHVRSTSLTTLEDTNYGDDIFANRKEDDAPYDLLYDIERIGNILYGHNDPATEIHFYDLRPVSSYQQDSPLLEKDYETKMPESSSENQFAQLPPTNGVAPSTPELSYQQSLDTRNQQFQPSDSKSVQWRTDQWFPTPKLAGWQNQSLTNPVTIQWWSLGNNICEAPVAAEPETRDLLKDAVDQQDETYTYGEALDLKDRVAIDIMKGLMPPEEEEKAAVDRWWPDPSGGWNDLWAGVINELNVDGDDGSLSATKDALKACLKASNLDENNWRANIRKKAGEAVALSQCVQNVLCKGVHDQSNRGLYSIKFCKIPSKRYNVTANMPIHSFEESLNEFRNICVNLKDSGQLIKHKQTKDGIFSTQLSNLKLKNMFNFEINFMSKPSYEEKDPRTEKLEQEETNKYLEKTVLQMTNHLTHENQRNKYLILYNPLQKKAQLEMQGVLDLEQERVAQAERFYNALQASKATEQDVVSQKKLMASTMDLYSQFIQQQTMMRDTVHGHLVDLNNKRSAKRDEFQHWSKKY
jgi:hypothetical protein